MGRNARTTNSSILSSTNVHTIVGLGFTHAVSSPDGGRTNPPQRDLQDMQSVAQRSGT